MNKPTRELRPHPENEKIYGRITVEQDFLDSIKRMGVLTPLLITWDNRIISGQRRWTAAQKLGLFDVPVLEFGSRDELDIMEAIVESNRQRQKSNEQLGREVQTLWDVEAGRAKARQIRKPASMNSVKEHVPEQSSREAMARTAQSQWEIENQRSQQRGNNDFGQTRDKVGEQLGISGKHAEKAKSVVDAIDKLTDQGKAHEAAVLRNTLNNKSVGAAYNKARDNGHIQPSQQAAPKPETPKRKTYITLDEWSGLSEAERFQAFNAKAETIFNAQKDDSIEWAKWSWNPITGCLHQCPYCYARDIAARFYEQGFEPSFYPNRLHAPAKMRVPQEANHDIGYKNVFTCSMADLFGKWVPAEWIEAVLDVIRANPQWNFLTLTKFPQRMAEFDFPDNAWVGTSVDKQYAVDRAEKAFRNINAGVKWLSCEPMLERLTFTSLEMFDWVAIGGASESTQTPEFRPPREWINHLEAQANEAGCKIYEKTNLLERIREYPGM